MRRHVLPLALLIAFPCAAQDKPAAGGLHLPEPDGVRLDEAARKRIESGYEREKELLFRLLVEVDQRRVDVGKDSMRQILAKRKALRASFQRIGELVLRTTAPPSALALNVVALRNETAPRLTGNVLVVGNKPGQLADLTAALLAAAPGDAIQLGPGNHTFPRQWDLARAARAAGPGRRWAPATDIAIIGAGPAATELRIKRGSSMTLTRWRLEGLKIDCGDNEFINLRSGGAVEVLKCEIANYNSGAGGSNAVFGSGSLMFIEDCTFEGLSGRSGRPGGSGGRAFDLRGDNVLFVRRTTFIDNSEIVRASFPAAFDQCRSVILKANKSWSSGISPYGAGLVFLRENKAKVRSPKQAVTFTLATDDAQLIDRALGKRKKALDPGSERLLQAIQVKRNLPFWIGLTRHTDVEVRTAAAKRITALTGHTVGDVKKAKPIDKQGLVPAYVAEWGRTVGWYEGLRDSLKWNPLEQRYEVK